MLFNTGRRLRKKQDKEISSMFQGMLESAKQLKRDMDNYPPGAANDPRAPFNKDTHIDCPECDGVGHFEESECCGAPISEDSFICSECLDHSGLTECEECKGTGIIKD